jgi:hypothetical protein
MDLVSHASGAPLFIVSTLIAIGGYALVLGVLYHKFADTALVRELARSSTPTSALTVVNSGGLFLVILIAAGAYADSLADFAYNLAAATCGMAFGTVLGIVISPTSADESSEFSLLTKAVSTLLTGYILANLKYITKPEITSFLNTKGVGFRLLIGTTCCLATVGVVFVTRRAEITKTAVTRDWFISYAPTDPRHIQTMRPDVLARGPFPSEAAAVAEIALIQGRPEFKGIDLKAVQVKIFVEQPVLSVATAGKPPFEEKK